MSDFHFQFERGTTAQTVLALHGTGGTEGDLIPLAQKLFPGAPILAPRGRVLEFGAARFFRRLSEGVFDLENLKFQTDLLADFVAASSTKHGFDAANVWALGYSNGANIAASLLLQRSETLAGAVLLRAMTPFEPQFAPDLMGKSVFLAAGDHDPMVPVANVSRLQEILQSAGAEATLHFERAGHNLNAGEFELIASWLKRVV